MTTVHIYAPPPVEVWLKRISCPTCGRHTFAVFSYYEWYGGDSTCLKCGDRWNEDGMAARPFERAWRAKSIAAAKKQWRRYQTKE